jgi:hypothetical protein
MTIGALPLILTLALPDWMYSQIDYIDAWVYHGFFRHMETYTATMFPGTYYGSRLGWIAPGYVSYRLFPPVIANIVLHVVFYGIAVGSLYAIVRRVAGASNALFAACAFGLYLPAVRSLGSDYVDGAVIAYALLAAAVGSRGVERQQLWLTFTSGMAIGAMMHSNIGAAFMLPSIVIWLVPSQREMWRSKSLWRLAATGTLGIVACTILLSIFSVAAGGRWDFFLQSVRWMQAIGLENPWDVTGVSWVALSPWVFLPAATLVASVIVLARATEWRVEQLRAFGALAALILVFAVWDFLGPGALLYYPAYASWLIPWTFVAIGGVLVPVIASARKDAAALLMTIVVLALSLSWPQYTRLPWTGLASLALVVAAISIAGFLRRSMTSRLLIAVSIALVHGALSRSAYFTPVPDRADAFRAIDRGVRLIDSHLTTAQPRFLLAPSKRLGHYVNGLTSVYLWGYTIAADQFPVVTAAQAKLIVPETTVIVLADDPHAATSFDQVFAPYGIVGWPRGSERIETMHGPLYMTVFQAKARSAS